MLDIMDKSKMPDLDNSNSRNDSFDNQLISQTISQTPILSPLPDDSKNQVMLSVKSKFCPKSIEIEDLKIEPSEIVVEIPKICKSCKKPFVGYETRTGINIFLLIIIIIFSILFMPILLLFIFLCKNYYVCPHCRNFTEHHKNKTRVICLG